VTTRNSRAKLVRIAAANLSLYHSIIRPILFSLSPESAHEFALKTLNHSAIRACFKQSKRFPEFGTLKRFGLEFTNPVGLAAGFDKNGTAAHALADLGFGSIEVGTVTNEPQSGNPKPRLFRLPQDQALINRLGFNNCGAQQLAENIRAHPPDCVVGVNIGKSRSVAVEQAIPDYRASFAAIYDIADYIAVNVSSPNTPNLRELQRAELLDELLSALQEKNRELAASQKQSAKPLLLKIAPDLNEPEIESIIEVAWRTGVSGIIATNTTVVRAGLRTPASKVRSFGDGGLSGAPLREPSNRIISLIFRLTQGRLPIIGVGGIFTADDAWEKICAGAGLVQLYTGFIYEGPGIAKRINDGLAEIMRREGFKSIDEAVGCRVK
jgi:dihydroorotate dehydrogenase